MLGKIKKFIANYKRSEKLIDYLQAKNKQLESEVKELKIKAKDPVEVINALTDDKFKWFDYEAITDEQELLSYHNHAQTVLKSIAFQNELNRLRTEAAKFTLNESNDFDAVRGMRFTVAGYELLEQRLQSIPDPTKQTKPSMEDLHAVL